MALASPRLEQTVGFLVADARGRMVGRVECALFGSRPDEADALAVKSGFLRQRRLVPAKAIARVDELSGVVGLSVVRENIRRFF
jgi:hypothetical protein